MRKTVSAFICALLVCSLFFTGLFCIGEVQATSKPSVPQFTVELFDYSYDVPTSTSTDSYTGVTTTDPSYRVDNRSIAVTIKNQPFISYTNKEGYECKLYYNVQVKGHFGDDTEWQAFFYSSGQGFYGGDYRYAGFAQSNSGYTTVSSIIQYPAGSLLDFRVEAFTGYWVAPTMGDHVIGMHSEKLVRDMSSSYSRAQTVTLTSDSLSLSPSPNPTYTSEQAPQTDQPTQTELTVAGFSLVEFGLVAACGVIVVLSIALIYTRKTARHKQTAQT